MVYHDCKYEEDIGYIKATLKSLDVRVNGSMDGVAEHIRQGHGWRKAIVSIICAGIFQIFTFAYFFGVLTKTVQTNEIAIKTLNKNTTLIEKVCDKLWGSK